MDSDQDNEFPSLMNLLIRLMVNSRIIFIVAMFSISLGVSLFLEFIDQGDLFSFFRKLAIGFSCAFLVEETLTIFGVARKARTILLLRRVRKSIGMKGRSKEIAISVTYLNHLRRRNGATKATLALAGLLSAGAQIHYPDFQLLPIAIVCTVVLSLITLKEVLIEYRVREGFFGTTRSEAKELIAFMVNHAKDIDFHDDNGTLRQALIPRNGELISPDTVVIPGRVSA